MSFKAISVAFCLVCAVFVNGDVQRKDNPLDTSQLTNLLKRNTCKAGFVKNSKGCYKIILGSKFTWDEAKTRCEAEGARLAFIESAEEMTELSKMVESSWSRHFWLGGRRFGANTGRIWDNSQWLWDEGECKKPFTYTNWWTELSKYDAGKECLYYYWEPAKAWHNTWWNAACSDKINAICEI